MSIRAYPSAEKLKERFSDLSKPVQLFYLLSSKKNAAVLRSQLTTAAHRGGGTVTFFARIDQLLVGEGKQPWTFAAMIRFSRGQAAINVARDSDIEIDAQRVAIYPIRTALPPPALQAALSLARPIGKLVDTGDADLAVPLVGIQREDVWPSPDQLAERVADTRECPVYCINFLSYRAQAEYSDGRPTTLTGVKAYLRYGMRAIAAVRALGGRILLGGHAGAPLTDEVTSAVAGDWDDIVIVRYPTPRTILKLDRIPWYPGGHVYRDAGLERTALLVASDVE
jgi:hypothetical protein